MTAAQRERAAVLIRRRAAAWSVAAASVREIDRYNIRRASALAMRRALSRLGVQPDHVIIDGMPLPELGTEHEALVHGDRVCASIAAASILAKCVRDRLMVRLARRYPVFRWDANKGYATQEHLDILDLEGPTPHHRKSFTPVVQLRAL
jgi:ribonuclease HII